MEAAIAPPTKACAVAVTSFSIPVVVNLIQSNGYDKL